MYACTAKPEDIANWSLEPLYWGQTSVWGMWLLYRGYWVKQPPLYKRFWPEGDLFKQVPLYLIYTVSKNRYQFTSFCQTQTMLNILCTWVVWMMCKRYCTHELIIESALKFWFTHISIWNTIHYNYIHLFHLLIQ